ncbi:YceI family protein [Neptunitalea lumnitzerae]|uniref:Polyisoprenoid-binding protein n=1 Tax=Neptunitalea lumnitzerae TaxID=2965509 RepID=A0ABQ5MG14_9FLAO|nr:YceI family protein [Neptunitalea sp. Y10]GLB48332.1 polyisoprenoid-binding protein [Neptunitalea sp. Y10]
MKKLLFVAIAFVSLSAFTVASKVWTNDDPHTQLGFTVTHLGINDISGAFTDVDITLEASKEDFSDAVFNLTAKTASIDTRVEARNNHLKSADFFDVEKYPTLTFKSTGIKKAGKDTYKIEGDLTMHGVTKKVSLKATYRGSVVNPMSSKETQGFQVTGTLKRSDFGIGEKFPEAVVSDEVRIEANAEFVQ